MIVSKPLLEQFSSLEERFVKIEDYFYFARIHLVKKEETSKHEPYFLPYSYKQLNICAFKHFAALNEWDVEGLKNGKEIDSMKTIQSWRCMHPRFSIPAGPISKSYTFTERS